MARISNFLKFALLGATAVAVVVAITWGFGFVYDISGARARTIMRTLPGTRAPNAKILEQARETVFLYVVAQADPSIVDELHQIASQGEWKLVDPKIVLNDVQLYYPGWFNPAFVSKSAICVQSENGCVIWAFNDGRIYVRDRASVAPSVGGRIGPSP
jgi:hypothetical protein